MLDNDILRLESMARDTMQKHGLIAWSFKWDNAIRRFGHCSFASYEISISKPLTLLNPESEFLSTLLHEIAHALVGIKNGHNLTWYKKCLEIGGNGQRLYSSEVVKPEKPQRKQWRGICPKCGYSFIRTRRVKKAFHKGCFTRKSKSIKYIRWSLITKSN